MKPQLDANGFIEQPALTRQNLSFWMLLQQRRRRKRTANLHRVIVAPASLLFGDVLVNGSKDLVVKIYNKTTHTVTLSAINVTSAQADWGIDAILPITILATATATVTLQFLPTATGIETAVFDLVTTAGTLSIGATGNGV